MHDTADTLSNDPEMLKELLLSERVRHLETKERCRQLEAMLASLRRQQFGPRSEQMSSDQMNLALEDAEVAKSVEKPEEAIQTQSLERKRKRNTNRGHLPAHLPREEHTLEPESTMCACGCEMQRIGEDRSERLDIIPARYKVVVSVRPKYACKACQEGVHQAPASERLIRGGIPTEALVADVLVRKFADHLPLYRQAQIMHREGLDLDRSTLAHWVGRAAAELRGVFEHLVKHLKQSQKLFMDETPAPVLDPGRGRTKTGYLWALARDDRPWGGNDPPGVVYFYAPGRSGKHAETFLKGYSGVLQVDGYAGYNRLSHAGREEGALTLAYCWTHARRKLHDIAQTNTAPIAAEGLQKIAALYAIEKEIRGQSAEVRKQIRQEKSAPLVDDFERWADRQKGRLSAKSRLAEALRYIINQRKGLRRFLEDGRIEMDSNIVERAIRPLTLNRKNALFAGNDLGGSNWGIVASLIETCKLNNVNPAAYLAHTLEAIVNRHPMSEIDQLMPWNFAKIPTGVAA